MSNKRKNGEAGSSRKRSRINQSNNSLNVDSAIEISQEEAEVGIIESVTLKNFMCHTRLEFKFGPHVNFIVGRNGSGKSAILTAVVIGLGGKATVTSRGSAVKGFIKNGKNFAELSIKLRNRGSDAFKHESYGDSIIVQRRLTTDGTSTYKLRSIDGNLVSTKREELMHILDQFNIQVDNPVSVLNQEVSRNFLNAKSPNDKYMFFLKATQLHQMDLDYNTADEQKRMACMLLEKKEQALPDIEREVNNWHQKYQYHRSMDSLREKIESLKNEIVWAQVSEVENDLAKRKKVLTREQHKHSKCQQKVSESKENFDEAKKEVDDLKAKIEEISGVLNNFDSERKNAKVQLDNEKQMLRTYATELRQIVTEIASIENDKKELLKTIEDLRNSNAQEEVQKQRELRVKQLEKLRSEKEDLNARRKTSEQYYQTLSGATAKIKEEIQSLTEEGKQLATELGDRKRKYSNVEAGKNNQLKRFGAWMPMLLQKIDDAFKANLFRYKPLGPLGLHISLRDSKWALAVECCIGGLLTAFCADNYNDERVLERLMRETIGNLRRPDIIVAKFENRLYDVSRHAVQSNEFRSVLDVLQVDTPSVANFLIDRRGIESILLIENNADAREVMSKRPPRNCYEAYTRVGDHVYAIPGYRYYSNKKSEARYLQANVDDYLGRIREEINNLEQRQVALHEQIKEKRQDYNKKNGDQQSSEGIVSKIKQQLKGIELELARLQNVDEPESLDVATFEAEVQSMDQQMNELLLKRKKKDDDVREKRGTVGQMEDELKELDSRISGIVMAKIDPVKKTLQDANKNLVNSEHETNHYEAMLEKQEAEMKEIEKTCHQLSKLIEENAAKAERVCARVETDRKAAAIETEIEQSTKQLQIQEAQRGSKEEVTRKYYDCKKKYEEIKSEIAQVKKFNTQLNTLMKKRRCNYADYRRLISIRVNNLFMLMLNQSKYQGKLMFDHDRDLLHIHVEPRRGIGEATQDARCLSGGERSFSTVCFILALWDAMESPFRILDEYDVFMDLVNRRMSMDLMLDVAIAKTCCQYCFLTPLDMTRLSKSSKIRIFKMADPDRNQGILPFGSSWDNNDDEEENQN